jgi:hypothetical protein
MIKLIARSPNLWPRTEEFVEVSLNDLVACSDVFKAMFAEDNNCVENQTKAVKMDEDLEVVQAFAKIVATWTLPPTLRPYDSSP